MTATTDNSRETVSIQEFLSKAASYGPHVAEVETRETHMSWVFLAGDRIYKLKKPVRYPFLDFTTLGARETDCRAEIRLNRRLAPDVYLGIVRLALESTGTLALDGEGETVDWLVVMRRLPEGRMLDNLIAQGAVNHGEIERVAGILAEFYRYLLDREVREPPKWPPLARQYLAIAERASLRLHPQAGRQANHSRGSAE